MRTRLRLWHAIIALCVVFGIGVYFSSNRPSNASFERSCVIPDLKAYDISILDYIKHPGPLKCKQIQPWYSFIDENGFLQFNESESHLDVKCEYYEYDKTPGHERTFKYDKPKPMLPGRKYALQKDFVYVTCAKGNDTVYKYIHAHPVDRKRKFRPVDEDHLSVLVFGIDSTSMAMLKRNLPATYEVLTADLEMYEMNGYNKIADSTFPNMVPLLTGRRVYSQQEDMPDEFNEDYQNGTRDHWPLIWKWFNASDYVTTMIEERSINGIFHYLQKGFYDKPTEYYYRPYYYAMDVFEEDFVLKSSKYCFGNSPKIELELDHLERHLRKFENISAFTYWYHTELSHDYPNDLQYADPFLAKFFYRMHQDNLFNHTIIFFVSDHGHRFGKIRQTAQGILEERLPMLLIYTPRWFKIRYASVHNALLTNRGRLICQFDVHQTFFDVLNANYSAQQKPADQRGHSLLYPIAEGRTCRDAGIPDQYCACYDLVPVYLSRDSELALKAAAVTINYLNRLLEPAKNECSEMSLESVDRAELVTFHGSDGERNRIRLWLTVEPKGWFESFVNYDHTNGEMTLHGDINRLDWYGETSYCISDVVLKKFCYCRVQKTE